MQKIFTVLLIANLLSTQQACHAQASKSKQKSVLKQATIQNPLPIGAVDLQTYNEYWKAYEAKDTHTAASFIMSGKMVSLNQNTKVRILNSGPSYYLVQINDVQHDSKNNGKTFFLKKTDFMPSNKTAAQQFEENMKNLEK